VRELREFREHHAAFESAGIVVAGVSRDTLERHREWAERLRLPYPLLADPEMRAARELGLVHVLGLGGWNVELFRRSTLLVDRDGIVAAVWGKVKVRGHALQVLEAARALQRPPA
jgi:peroxiredoxin Q/BCP